MTLVLALAACAPRSTPQPAPLPTQAATLAPLPSVTAPPPPTLTPAPSPTEPPAAQVCPPLAGYTLDQLAAQVSNPYHPPPPGSDDPHYGVDLADFDPADRIARAGMPVQAVLNGRVAGLTADRFPYGNLLVVETRLDELPPSLAAGLRLPAPLEALTRPLALSCPDLQPLPGLEAGSRSLYLLYAHLRDAPSLSAGDPVACGEPIGAVGDSGNALAPHLHLEVRVGPSGVLIPAMAHYDPSASMAEIESYCLWRISGLFQSIDPACLLASCPPDP